MSIYILPPLSIILLQRRLGLFTCLLLMIVSLVFLPFQHILLEGGAWPGGTLSHHTLTTNPFTRQVVRMTASASTFTTRQVGAKFSLEYRCFLQDGSGKVISPFHDVPLYHDEAAGILNMVVEVSRFSNAKLEISKDEAMNPIKQDVKKGALRFVKNCFPYHGYLWNYGAFPQTWESPVILDHATGIKGDNDPIDVIEIGSRIAQVGEVRQVKVLGALAMLDEGETDWKIVAIDVNDPLAPQLDDSDDLERVCPGLLDATRNWFKVYKIPDGKPPNSFAFDGQVKNKTFAMEVIRSVNGMWKELIMGKIPSKTNDYNIAINSRNVEGSPGAVTPEDEAKMPKMGKNLSDNPVPESVNGWSFIPPQH